MARPSIYDTGEVVTVLIEGKAASWCDGLITGDPDMVEAAWFAIRNRSEFRIGFVEVTAGDRNLLEVAAALASLSPGLAQFPDLPDDVADILSAGHADPSIFAGASWAGGDE